MEEKVFFKNSDVTVTQARFIASGKTYAMNNISSVSMGVIKASKTWTYVLIAIGLIVMVAAEGSSKILGILLIAGGIAGYIYTKDSYTVKISSNSGEADGYISKDKELVEKIVNSLNDAVIHRG